MKVKILNFVKAIESNIVVFIKVIEKEYLLSSNRYFD